MSHDPEVKAMLTECHRILKELEASTARAAAPVVTPGVSYRRHQISKRRTAA